MRITDLFETDLLRLHADDYHIFMQEWGDEIYEAGHDFSYEEFLAQLQHYENIDLTKLYRGIRVPPTFPVMLQPGVTPLGMFWSTDHYIAADFANVASTGYDDRFARKVGAPVRTDGVPMILHGSVDITDVDVLTTMAMNIVGGEGEIRLKPDAQIQLNDLRSADGRPLLTHDKMGVYPA